MDKPSTVKYSFPVKFWKNYDHDSWWSYWLFEVKVPE